jgi:hypothetical protein
MHGVATIAEIVLVLGLVLYTAGVIYRSIGAGVFIDSEEWVRVNRERLWPADQVNKVFNQLKTDRLHVLFGCPFHPAFPPLLSGNISEDARYADVVSVYCVDWIIGPHLNESDIDAHAEGLLQGSAAGAAYAALHASEPRQREKAARMYERIKNARPDLFFTLSGVIDRPHHALYQLMDKTGVFERFGPTTFEITNRFARDSYNAPRILLVS